MKARLARRPATRFPLTVPELPGDGDVQFLKTAGPGPGAPEAPTESMEPSDSIGALDIGSIEPTRPACRWSRRRRPERLDLEPEDKKIRSGDVDEWGRSEHMRALARTALRPDLPPLVPRRVGRPREDPDRRRRAARRQPRRRDPVRRAGDHARHRDRARAAGLRPGRPPVPARCRSSARSGPASAACPPTPTTPTGCCASSKQLVLVFPEGTQGHRQDSTASATSCAGSGGAASSRSRCGPACRSCRSRWSAPRSRCRSCSRAAGSPSCSSLPYFPITANMLAFGPLGARRATSRPSSSCGCSTRSHFDVPPDQERYSRSRIMDESERIREHDPGGALRHAPRRAAASGSAEA